MKPIYRIILAVVLLIVNNLLFSMHTIGIVHIIQLFVSFLLFVGCLIEFVEGEQRKQYKIPLLFAFVFAARNLEEIVRKGLLEYFPEIYQIYKLYIFIAAVVLLLVAVILLNERSKRTKAS